MFNNKPLFSEAIDKLCSRILTVGAQRNLTELSCQELLAVMRDAGLSDSRSASCFKQIEDSVPVWLRSVERHNVTLFSAVVLGRIAEIIGREACSGERSDSQEVGRRWVPQERVIVAIVPMVDLLALTKNGGSIPNIRSVFRIARWVWSGTPREFRDRIEARLWNRRDTSVPEAFLCVAIAFHGPIEIVPNEVVSVDSLVARLEGRVRDSVMSDGFPIELVYDMGLQRL